MERSKEVAPDSNLYVCVHGHFYQPPRENPWLETVEEQKSAAPYHDWNDRITAECYAPNGASRIQNLENQIIRIVNNYSRMSYNFGPTLLSWLNDFAPRTYRMVLDADKTSAQRYSGHGSAMAQVYNHIIMPLANERDARTQVRWGIADFEHRYGRKPEGMWLAETAVNRSVLDLLAQEGILFTVLAPHQCARVRNPEQTEDWTDTPYTTVSTMRPYRVPLDEGRSIAVFFYNGPASRAIAFEGLLNSGDDFGKRLIKDFNASSGEPQLSHVATDGESYGHHHKHGEMALSYAMHWIEHGHVARLTNYGEFLEKFPPQWEAEVIENTSWSCAHGVERWRSDCGCNGGRPGWNQAWRGPLREALDLLRDSTAPLAEAVARPLLKDLWEARNAYIHVIMDRSRESTDRFLEEHQEHILSPAERITVLELLELQRQMQLMYTSCGWFFDEISGIETVQIIAYAGRVLQLAAKIFGAEGAALEPAFLEILARANSNLPEFGDGAEVYRRYVTGLKIGLEEVGAHYAISSIFRSYPEDGALFCYNVHRDTYEVFTSGRGKVALGRAQVHSRITEETEEICFAVLHLGDQNLSAAVRAYDSGSTLEIEEFQQFTVDVGHAMRRANLPEVIRLIDRFFARAALATTPTQHEAQAVGAARISMDPALPAPALPAPSPESPIAYSLTSLFTDEQHRILRTILNQTLSEMEDSLRKIYEDHASLLHFLTESGMAAPPALALAAEYAINAGLRLALESEAFDAVQIETLLERANIDQITLDSTLLGYTAGQRMKRAMVRLEASVSGDNNAAAALASAVSIALSIQKMPFEVNLWQAQNIWNDLLRRSDTGYWTDEIKTGFRKLGESLNIAVNTLVTEEGVLLF